MSIFRALLFAIIVFVDIASGSRLLPAMEIEEPVYYDVTKPGLYIYAFNTGQANFIIMRHGNNAYIVDAGCNKKSQHVGLDKELKEKVESIVDDLQLQAVFITHPHTDHYNLLNDVLRTFNGTQKQNPAFYLGGYLKHYPQDLSINSGKTVYVSPLQSVEVPGIDGLSFKIIPSSVQQKTSDKNTYSYMLLVTYKERNILFGGDYILKAQNIEQVKKLLPQKLDVVFLPHHGSVRTKSETLIKEISYALNESGTAYVEEKCDVSDDDAVSALPHVEQEGERQCLFFICGGTNSNVKNAPIFDNLLAARGTIKPHNICLRDLKGPVGADDTTRPLFTTQGAEYGFYGIRINQMDGSIEMRGVNSNSWESQFENNADPEQTTLQQDFPGCQRTITQQ